MSWLIEQNWIWMLLAALLGAVVTLLLTLRRLEVPTVRRTADGQAGSASGLGAVGAAGVAGVAAGAGALGAKAFGDEESDVDADAPAEVAESADRFAKPESDLDASGDDEADGTSAVVDPESGAPAVDGEVPADAGVSESDGSDSDVSESDGSDSGESDESQDGPGLGGAAAEWDDARDSDELAHTHAAGTDDVGGDASDGDATDGDATDGDVTDGDASDETQDGPTMEGAAAEWDDARDTNNPRGLGQAQGMFAKSFNPVGVAEWDDARDSNDPRVPGQEQGLLAKSRGSEGVAEWDDARSHDKHTPNKLMAEPDAPQSAQSAEGLAGSDSSVADPASVHPEGASAEESTTVADSGVDATVVEESATEAGSAEAGSAEAGSAEAGSTEEVEPVAEAGTDAGSAGAVATAAGSGFVAGRWAGSALPGDDGAGPNGYPIKGNEDSMKYHTDASPYYGRTQAEVWFDTEDNARAAGFVRWDDRSGSGATLAAAAATGAAATGAAASAATTDAGETADSEQTTDVTDSRIKSEASTTASLADTGSAGPVAAGPFGAGSAEPLADGGAPSATYTVKGNADSMKYHTTESPYFGRTKAEVWFDTEDSARAAGFVRWNDKSGATPAAFASVPEGAFGPGSADPLEDGLAPAGFTIKGNEDSMLFHTDASPYYGRTKAEVWFDTEERARAAGFVRWDEN